VNTDGDPGGARNDGACALAGRRILGRVLGLALGLALVPLAGCRSEDGPREARHVVLVVVDTLRADHVGLYGYGRDVTPRLDAFARERGVVFDAARATAPWTKPSVASILTGLDPRHHRVTLHHHALHGGLRTLAEAFDDAGWQTGAIQSNPYLHDAFGFDQGFERYDQRAVATHAESTGEALHGRVVSWLDRVRASDQRFFLYVHHYEPHHRYLLPGDAYEDERARSVPEDRRAMLIEATMDQLVGATAELTPDDAAFLAARYDAEVRYQDALIGELVDALDERGLLDETLFVFTSDHGEEFLDHGDVSHQAKLTDELLRVPLVIARPGEPRPGRRVAEPVSLADLGRTLLDLAGLEAVAFPGRSLAPLLDGEAVAPSEVIAHAAARRLPRSEAGAAPEASPSDGEDGEGPVYERDAIVRGSWKLVRDRFAGGLRLYDLGADPRERRDVAAEHPDVVGTLERALEEHLERGGVGAGALPEEDAEVVRARERELERLADELDKLGYVDR